MTGGNAADYSPAGGGAESARHLAHELDEEEQELWRQLRRKRDFEGRVAEKRAQLSELRDRRRNVSTAHSEAVASVEYLQSELEFAREQEREIEHDIAMLKESNRILQEAFQKQQQQKGGSGPVAPYSQNRDARDILAEEKKRQESVQLQHEQIAHLRAHIEKLSAEKSRLHQRQQILFDKQRSAEQDRNRLLGHLQDDRSGINEVRQERIKLWEERTRMEREMAQIVRLAQKGGIDTTANFGAPPSSPPPSSVPGASGGVRGRVTADTPQAFTNAPSAFGGGGVQGSAGMAPMDTTQRAHWTGFGDSGGMSNAGGNGAGGCGGGFGGGFPGGTAGVGVPPSFGDLSSALGTRGADSGSGGGGITEWASKMRDYRGSATGSPGNHF